MITIPLPPDSPPALPAPDVVVPKYPAPPPPPGKFPGLANFNRVTETGFKFIVT